MLIAAALRLQAASPAADLPAQDSTAQDSTAQYCPDIHFLAYSTLEQGGTRYEESVSWDSVRRAYIIKGPTLAYLLNDPGVADISADSTRTTYEIAIRPQLSRPSDRFCEQDFQEAADCDVHGQITYTQLYRGCDQQLLQHLIKLTPDSAGSLQLLDLRFSDVRGNFGDPLILAAGSDLRLRIRG